MAVSVKTGVIIIFLLHTLTLMSLMWSKSGTGLGLLKSQKPLRQMYSFLMIRKKLSYNIQSMLTMPAFQGLHPTIRALQQPLSSSGQLDLMGVTAASFSTKYTNHSTWRLFLTEVFIFVDKKKRINHHDLFLAFTVEPSTNHSRDSSLLSLL